HVRRNADEPDSLLLEEGSRGDRDRRQSADGSQVRVAPNQRQTARGGGAHGSGPRSTFDLRGLRSSRRRGPGSRGRVDPVARAMIGRELAIRTRLGLHARAAAKFVQTASRFRSSVKIRKNGEEVDGKSILGILLLAASQGTRIVITASGEDEAEAIA